MHQYRIYCLDEEGRFRKVHEIEAADDRAALASARALHHDGECEVWRDNRLIGRIQPQPDASRQMSA